MTEDKSQLSKKASPLEGPTDDGIMDDFGPDQNHPSNSAISSTAKKSLYFGIAIVIAFVLLKIGLGLDVFSLSLYLFSLIESATLNILPWIFLYYFILFVRSFMKGKQG